MITSCWGCEEIFDVMIFSMIHDFYVYLHSSDDVSRLSDVNHATRSCYMDENQHFFLRLAFLRCDNFCTFIVDIWQTTSLTNALI